MKIGIFYGSTTGNTQAAAEIIQTTLEDAGDVTLENIADVALSALTEHDLILLGASTWGFGDLQDDWLGKENFSGIDLSGKKVAVFGTGDQQGFSDTYVDSLGILAKAAENAGAALIGAWSTDGYEFSGSASVRDGKFVGLALDEDNQSELTAGRIADWCAQLKAEMA